MKIKLFALERLKGAKMIKYSAISLWMKQL